MNTRALPILLLILLSQSAALPAADALTLSDPLPQRYEFTARASEIDPRARPHPEIDFVFEKNGQPADGANASVANHDQRVDTDGASAFSRAIVRATARPSREAKSLIPIELVVAPAVDYAKIEPAHELLAGWLAKVLPPDLVTSPNRKTAKP